jgi:hypothetical protein
LRVETYLTPTHRFAKELALRRGNDIGEDLQAKITNAPNEVSFTYTAGHTKKTAPMKVFANVMCFPRTISAHESAIRKFQTEWSTLLLTQPTAPAPPRTVPVKASAIDFKELNGPDYWWKFFCQTGWLTNEAGRLVFNPGNDKSKTVDIVGFAMCGHQVVDHITLHVTVDDTQ